MERFRFRRSFRPSFGPGPNIGQVLTESDILQICTQDRFLDRTSDNTTGRRDISCPMHPALCSSYIASPSAKSPRLRGPALNRLFWNTKGLPQRTIANRNEYLHRKSNMNIKIVLLYFLMFRPRRWGRCWGLGWGNSVADVSWKRFGSVGFDPSRPEASFRGFEKVPQGVDPLRQGSPCPSGLGALSCAVLRATASAGLLPRRRVQGPGRC